MQALPLSKTCDSSGNKYRKRGGYATNHFLIFEIDFIQFNVQGARKNSAVSILMNVTGLSIAEDLMD